MPFERVRLLLVSSWAARFAGVVLLPIRFWMGAVLLVVSWRLYDVVRPRPPAPDFRDGRLTALMIGFGVAFCVGWTASLFPTDETWPFPMWMVGFVGLVVCDFTRHLRVDAEFLATLRAPIPEPEPESGPELELEE